MKKVILSLVLLLQATFIFSQTFYQNVTITKTSPTLFLNGAGAVINFNASDVTITLSSNLLSLMGGNLSLGTNSLLLTGSIGSTGSRVTKGWYTDLQVTNAIAGSITGNAATATILANARTIYGNSFNGSASLTQIISSTYGGTGNAYFQVSGPDASIKTFIFPNANATIARTDASQTFSGTQTFSTIAFGSLPLSEDADTILVWHNGRVYYTTKDIFDGYVPPEPPVTNTYYIDPSGVDDAGRDGRTTGQYWKTLSYACTRVTTGGKIIHVNPGSYTETAQSILADSVSIEGDGDVSVINSNVGGTAFTILAESGSVASNGFQHISNIKMNGNSYTAYGAIRIAYRKNVEIYNCTFTNFDDYGVSFINGEPPATYATGNKFYNNSITNCSTYSGGNTGCLEMQGQDGMLVYNNTIIASRTDNNNGNCIYGVEGFLKNCEVYNNTLTKTFVVGTTHWPFSIEFWNLLGGNKIYNNIITGNIDLLNCVKGTSSYSVWVYGNTISEPSLLASESTAGINLEAYFATSTQNLKNIIIEKNKISNMAIGVRFNLNGACDVNVIDIRYNTFSNIGMNGTNSKGWGILYDDNDVYTSRIDSVRVWNNVFTGYTGNTTMWGIELPDQGTVTNVSIRNNIVKDFDYAPTFGWGHTGTTIDTLSIENNIFYSNGNSNLPRYATLTPSHNTTQNNLTSDPLFISTTDFHLQNGSPAINAGISVGLGGTTDLDGVTIATPPEIGTYEK